jgi:hypothetical protein
MTVFDVINRALSENQQNVIDLTNPDYEAQPLDLQINQRVKFKVTIDISRADISNEGLIWSNDTYGLWDDFDWADDDPLSYSVMEEIVSDGFNQNGVDDLINNTKTIWGYMAYGSGEVDDDDLTLESEIARLDSPYTNVTDNYFEQKYIMDEDTSNGNLISELGLATAATGNISSTELPYPLDKNNRVYASYHLRTYMSNF